MINKFLNVKHWQLFILVFGIPFLFQVFMMNRLMSKFSTEVQPDPELLFNHMKLTLTVVFIFMAVLLGWFWSVAIGLQRVIPSEFQLKISRFKIFLFIPIIYILFFMGYFISSLNSGGPNPVVFVAILPIHLFSMFCIFYCLYFVAKTFKTAELKRKVTFSDFAVEFFLFWLYPIGIWIIQPKINKLINEKTKNSISD